MIQSQFHLTQILVLRGYQVITLEHNRDWKFDRKAAETSLSIGFRKRVGAAPCLDVDECHSVLIKEFFVNVENKMTL